MALRIVFLGTPDFAVPTLRALIASRHEVAAVYCQPPRPAGRGLDLKPSPVQRLAEDNGLPVRTPRNLRPPEDAAFAALKPDVAVVVAYGLLLPAPVLAAPRLGCLNLHPSKLPRWRGAAPIQRTLMAGDRETEFCVMRMDAGLDTGPVCLAEPFAIPEAMTAGALHDLAAERGAALMLRALDLLEEGRLPETPQSPEGAVYAPKIDKAEARIDWSRAARDVHNHIRGLSPFPGAWFEATVKGRAERVKALRSEVVDGRGAPGEALDDRLTIACGDGAVRLLMLQRAGKAAMPAADFLRGLSVAKGDRLG